MNKPSPPPPPPNRPQAPTQPRPPQRQASGAIGTPPRPPAASAAVPPPPPRPTTQTRTLPTAPTTQQPKKDTTATERALPIPRNASAVSAATSPAHGVDSTSQQPIPDSDSDSQQQRQQQQPRTKPVPPTSPLPPPQNLRPKPPVPSRPQPPPPPSTQPQKSADVSVPSVPSPPPPPPPPPSSTGAPHKPKVRHIPPGRAPPGPPPNAAGRTLQVPSTGSSRTHRRSLSFGDATLMVANESTGAYERTTAGASSQPAPLTTSMRQPMRTGLDDTALVMHSASSRSGDIPAVGEGILKSLFSGWGKKQSTGDVDSDYMRFLRTAPPVIPPPMAMRSGAGELVKAIKEMESTTWDSPLLVDYWTSRPVPLESWVNDYASATPLLVDYVACSGGWRIEADRGSVTKTLPEPAEPFVVNSDDDYAMFKEFISAVPHDNYVVQDGPLIISVESATTNGMCKAIVRSKKDDRRYLLPQYKPMKFLKQVCPLLKDAKLTKVKGTKLTQDLVQYESRLIHTACKFGVLYCKPNLKDENELYSAQGGSAAYDEFLEWLGEKVVLQGFTKYRGGLDIKSNNTGTHSVYTTFAGYEIMFHVATLLPFVETDKQKLERKRHIGNDVVVLVFKDQADPSDTFNPLILTSHFIHCVLVVTPELDAAGKTTHYRLTVGNKPGVPPYPPYLPEVPRFEKGAAFHDFLMAKMINGGKTALVSPEFNSLLTARRDQLAGMCETALQQQ